MSTLLVDELYPGVEIVQQIKVSRSTSVFHIRPWVYKHGSPATGIFTLKVYDGATLLATSEITAADLTTEISGTYAHGFVRFDFENLILNIPEGSFEKEYTLKFSMPGYIKDTANFLGMVRRYEAKTYPTYGVGVVGNEAPNDFVEPFGLEVFEYRMV
jgi:hypothetical protein